MSAELIDAQRPLAQVAALGACLQRQACAAGDDAARLREWDARVQCAFAQPRLDEEQALALFGAPGLQGLVHHGVLAPTSSGRFEPRLALRLVGGRLIVTDLPMGWDGLPPDYVDPLWEAPGLAHLLLPCSGGDTLDLGCGSGVLALALAGRSRSVSGCDLNPRALSLSRFNAALNGLADVCFVHSDLFAAFGERRFERIVFNAPVGDEFVPRDLLHAGEDILEAFFRQLPDRLSDGGIAQVNLCGKDWHDGTFIARIERWLGSAAAQFQFVFLEQWRIDSGRRFAMQRLRASLRTGRNCFACKAYARGWLTVRRKAGAPSWSLATNYHDWVLREPPGSGARLIQALLDADGPGASPCPEQAAAPSVASSSALSATSATSSAALPASLRALLATARRMPRGH